MRLKSLAKMTARPGQAASPNQPWVSVMGAVAITVAAMTVCWLMRPVLGEGIFAVALAGTTLCTLCLATIRFAGGDN